MQQTINILANYQFNLQPCLVNCSNMGQCFLMNNTKYICVCTRPYYKGESCQFDNRPCSSNPCLNNGMCMTGLNETDFTCNCSLNFYGTFCEKKMNVCLNKTCSENGYCHNIHEMPICKCFQNFYGQNCEFQEAYVKVVRVVKISSLIILLGVIGMFSLWIFCNDILSIFMNVNKTGREGKVSLKNIQHFRYHPFEKA